jgi:hypothetical protein
MILIPIDTYINAMLISKYFIMVLCIITSIEHQVIMMR